MKHFSLERQLRGPINEWVRSQGLEPVNEYPICWRIPDVLGVRDRKIEVAIELKLSDLRTASTSSVCYGTSPCSTFSSPDQGKRTASVRDLKLSLHN
jgi:hypothetical protein